MVGQVGQQQGRWGDAQLAYEESLGISRRLCAMLGDTPESLRDLAISYERLGELCIANGLTEQAVNFFYDELAIGKRLTEMLPTMSYYTNIETYSRYQIKQLTGIEVE
jgi:hypothetical protein